MINLSVKTDGGSRGNPGQAACGAAVWDENGHLIKEISKSIGIATNNQAEYRALEIVLTWIVEECGQARVKCFLDSQLVVEQLNGRYKLKNAALKPLFERIKELINQLGGNVFFTHIPREENKLADKLVNQALDSL